MEDNLMSTSLARLYVTFLAFKDNKKQLFSKLTELMNEWVNNMNTINVVK